MNPFLKLIKQKSCLSAKKQPSQHQLALVFGAIASCSSSVNLIIKASLHNNSAQKCWTLVKVEHKGRIWLQNVSAPTLTDVCPLPPGLLCTAFIMCRSLSQVRTSPSLAEAEEDVGVAASATSSISTWWSQFWVSILGRRHLKAPLLGSLSRAGIFNNCQNISA